MTRIPLGMTVLEAAKKRIGWLYDEFERVVVGSSGGKDSTVVMELAIEQARARGRLPVDVMWLDQEAEWQGTVEYFRKLRRRPEVRLHWFQTPFQTNNSASGSEEGEWLYAWELGARWMRDHEPGAITERILPGTKPQRFAPVLKAMPGYIFKGQRACVLTGMRAEESPNRHASLTTHNAYKGVSWGSGKGEDYLRFHPLYDWGWRDVWTAICDYGWDYHPMYDEYFRKGVPFLDMRVSALTHEVAVRNLRHLQEVEPQTWDRLVERVPGIHTCGTMAEDWFPDELPEMFKNWREYRNHLMQTLVEPHRRPNFQKTFDRQDRQYLLLGYVGFDEHFCRAQCKWIANNDWEGVKAASFEQMRVNRGFARWARGLRNDYWTNNNPRIPQHG